MHSYDVAAIDRSTSQEILCRGHNPAPLAIIHHHRIIFQHDILQEHFKDTGAYEIIEMVHLGLRVVLDGKKS